MEKLIVDGGRTHVGQANSVQRAERFRGTLEGGVGAERIVRPPPAVQLFAEA